MKNLKNKVRYSLGVFGLILFSVMISLVLIVIIRNVNDNLEANEKVEESEDITELKEKVNNAIKDYPYSILVIDSQSYIKGIENDYSQYVITSEKDNVYKSYMFRNADTSVYQCWDRNNSGKIDLFIYSEEFDVWVKTEMDEEPMVSNVWSITEGMENYEISDELEFPEAVDEEERFEITPRWFREVKVTVNSKWGQSENTCLPEFKLFGEHFIDPNLE
jgi:hypothetical protein